MIQWFLFDPIFPHRIFFLVVALNRLYNIQMFVSIFQQAIIVLDYFQFTSEYREFNFLTIPFCHA